MKVKWMIGLMVALMLPAVGRIQADVLYEAITLWHMEDGSDANGPIFTGNPGNDLGGVDVSGASITASNFDGWAMEATSRFWYNTVEPPYDLVQSGAISVFVRVKMASIAGPGDPTHAAAGTQAHIWNMPDGNCELNDSYRLQLTDGKPTFSVMEDDGSGENAAYTDVIASGAIQTDVWYDITGVFDPDNDLLSVTVANPVTGEEIETATLAVAFDNIQPTETLGNGNNDGEYTWFGYPCNFNTDGTGNQSELTAVWDRALDPSEVAALSGVAPFATEESDGATEVSEAGETTDSFTVVLTSQPTDSVAVTIDPETADVQVNGAGPNNPTTLTFTTADWDTAQVVTVQANNDAEGEGPETVNILLSSASNDTDFVGKSAVAVTILDDDAVGVTVDEGDGVNPVEGGTDDTYSIVLLFAPNSDVTITIDDASEPNQVTINGGNEVVLTFTPGNGLTPQTVAVAAIDDAEPEAEGHAATLTHVVSQPGGDGTYEGFAIANVAVSVGENDCGAGPFAAADLDEDCLVGLTDYAAIAAKWLNCSITSCL